MLVAKDIHTTGLILKLTKPVEPADQWIEDGILHFLRLDRPIQQHPQHHLSARRRQSSLNALSPLAGPAAGSSAIVQTVRERMEASMRICLGHGRWALTAMEHFVRDWLRQIDPSLPTDDEFARQLEKGSIELPTEAEMTEIEAELRSYKDQPEWSLLSQHEDEPSKEKTPYDMEWLEEKAALIHASQVAAGNHALGPEELVDCIIGTLQSTSAGSENDLLELIGFDFIEIVSEIIENKSSILESHEHEQLLRAAALVNAEKDVGPGQRVQVRTTSMIKARTEGEKLAKKKGILLSGVSTQMRLEQDAHHMGLTDEALRKILSAGSSLDSSYFPGVFKSSNSSTAGIAVPGSKLALPVGTVREDTVEFEQFCLPFNSSASLNPRINAIKMVKIDQLDPVSRRAFPGYTSLNRMQSAVFQVAHETAENMLVCAPTGAGKTDVAMLTVLRCILDHMNPGGEIRKSAFKIVYVAPMKALAAEITEKFGRRLAPYGIKVREYTGDMQLSRAEVRETQMIVTTPEKWDVITRKGQGDIDLVDAVRLLIIDEVHLLQDERGPVIETIVARTLRAVEQSQRPVRIVGLSATLPNYIDVAMFLRVNLQVGMFYFDDSFRPVPLTQTLVGVKGNSESVQRERLNKTCFKRAVDFLKEGHQVMVFVHSRNETVTTAKTLIKMSREEGYESIFLPADEHRESMSYKKASVEVSQKSRNRELQDLFRSGLAMHHAGMLRSDRNIVENLFAQGHIRLLVCTATLAWGVNLPAHAVIIKGTQLWDSQKGSYIRLGILDVLQIFGRAGRPQYESHGEAVLLTKQTDLYHYLTCLMTQTPIESRLGGHMIDNLNAEVSLGTVTSVQEAVRWLGYTYLRIRMGRNPTAYGLTPKQLLADPMLDAELSRLATEAAIALRNAGMVSYDPSTGRIGPRDIGRIASIFYLTHETVELFGRTMTSGGVTEESVLAMVSESTEFNQMRVRPEELEELDTIEATSAPLSSGKASSDKTSSSGKAAILIQAWISRHPVEAFSLGSDLNYIGQNTGRVMRAAWEMAKSQGWARAARACLALAIAFERRVWMTANPICQILLSDTRKTKNSAVPIDVLDALQDSRLSPIEMRNMSISQLLAHKSFKRLANNASLGATTGMTKALEAIKAASLLLPTCEAKNTRCYPISENGFQVTVDLDFTLKWDDKYHGSDLLLFHVWLEGPDGEHLMTRETVTEVIVSRFEQKDKRASFFLPSIPQRVFVRVLSDRWNLPPMLFEVKAKCSTGVKISVKNSENIPPSAETLSLVRALGRNPEDLNVVQNAALSILETGNGFLAAPSGSDQELLILLALVKYSGKKILMLSPYSINYLEDAVKKVKAIGVRTDTVIILPSSALNMEDLPAFDVLILDHFELLDSDLELALTKNIVPLRSCPRRFVLSHCSIANAYNIAKWLGIDNCFLFGPESRPSPLQVQIQGFPGRFQASRQAFMCKPIYQAASKMAIESSGNTIVWCSSRKQSMLIAQSLIAFASNEDVPERFMRLGSAAGYGLHGAIQHCASFGIGIVTAEGEKREIVSLFKTGQLGVIIATFEDLFDLNLTADLVIVAGTDMGGNEIPHQVIRHALSAGIKSAIIMTRDNQKTFYRHLLCESLLLESHLCCNETTLPSCLFAIKHEQTIPELVKWISGNSLLGHCLSNNPLYYACQANDKVGQDEFLLRHIEAALSLIKDIPPCSGLSFQACAILTGDGTDELSIQSILNLISVAIATEDQVRKSTSLSKVHSPPKDSEYLEQFCSQSQAMQPVLRWITGVSSGKPKLLNDFNLPATKVLVLLLAHFAGISSLPRAQWQLDISRCLDLFPRMVQYMLANTRLAANARNLIVLQLALSKQTLPIAYAVTPGESVELLASVHDGKGNRVKAVKPGQHYTVKIFKRDTGPKIFVSAAAAQKRAESLNTLGYTAATSTQVEEGFVLIESSGHLLTAPEILRLDQSIGVIVSGPIQISFIDSSLREYLLPF